MTIYDSDSGDNKDRPFLKMCPFGELLQSGEFYAEHKFMYQDEVADVVCSSGKQFQNLTIMMYQV